MIYTPLAPLLRAFSFLYLGVVAQGASKISQLFRLLFKKTLSTVTLGVIDLAQFLKVFIIRFIDKAKQGFKAFIEWIEELLGKNGDDIVREVGLYERERRIAELTDVLGGRLLNKKDLDLLKYRLKSQYGVELRLIDKELGYQKLPVNTKDGIQWVRSSELLKGWDKRNVYGKFHEGPPPMIILRANNASELTVFHEMVHMSVYLDKLPKMNIIDEEILVFERILATKESHGWTDNEIIDSYNYVNDIITQKNRATGKSYLPYINPLAEQIKNNYKSIYKFK